MLIRSQNGNASLIILVVLAFCMLLEATHMLLNQHFVQQRQARALDIEEGFYAGEMAAIHGAHKTQPVGNASGISPVPVFLNTQMVMRYESWKLNYHQVAEEQGIKLCGGLDLPSGTKQICVRAPAAISPCSADSAPVDQLYRAILGRNPNPGESQAFLNDLANGIKSIEDIEGELRASAEYGARIPTDCVNNPTDNYVHIYTAEELKQGLEIQEDITALLRALLGRFPNQQQIDNAVRGFLGCPTPINPKAPWPLHAYINNYRASTSFTGAQNNSQLHAEPIREIFLQLLGRDPARDLDGHLQNIPELLGWLGRLTNQSSNLNQTISLSPNFLYGGPTMILWIPTGAVGGVAQPGPSFFSEIISNPDPARQVLGTAIPPGITDLPEFAENGGSQGTALIALFRALLRRVPKGPNPSSELTYYRDLMAGANPAPLSYVAQSLRASAEFATVTGSAVACAKPPIPVCELTADKTSVAPGENVNVTLHAFANVPLEGSEQFVRMGAPPVGWDGQSPAGTITSIQWNGAVVPTPGVITLTRSIMAGAVAGELRQTATVTGPDGTSTCEIAVPVIAQKLACTIHMTKRGPGWGSRWQFGGNGDRKDKLGPYAKGGGSQYIHAFYNSWRIWIPGRPDNEFRYQTDYRYGTGYGYVGSADPLITDRMNHDMCNRNYSVSGCGGNVNAVRSNPMPAYYDHTDGLRYQLMTRLSDGTAQTYANGGVCGSPDCKCWLSGVISPLVVRFNDSTLKLKHGVWFDLGEGKKYYFWPQENNDVAFLSLDKNGDGKISDIHEIFGNRTEGPDGKEAATGFESLAKYDSNHDAVMDAKDAIFSQLQLWFDRNADGVTDPGELEPLSNRGVSLIDLKYESVEELIDNYGNVIRQKSRVYLDTGVTQPIVDIYFAEGNPSEIRGTK